MQVLYVRGGYREIMNDVSQLPSICAGIVPEYSHFAVSFAAVVGNAFLANVKQNYAAQSRSEKGFDNTVWVPNAYRTVVRKVDKFKGALKGKSSRAQAFRQRYEEYKKNFAATKARLKSSYVTSKDPAIKKQQAALLEQVVKAAVGDFAHVVRQEVGFDDVRAFQLTAILRDTGRMFNSLTAGIDDQPYCGPDADAQVFLPQPGMVTVGTNVLYAATHQHGDATRGIPARPFFPEPDKVPADWLEDMRNAAKTALARFIREVWRPGQP